MTERPILFSAPMVRAILARTKTQTRRVAIKSSTPGLVVPCDFDAAEAKLELENTYNGIRYWKVCPYGNNGDRLWVREAFDFLPSGGLDEPQACEIVYWATGSHEPRSAPSGYNPMIYGHEKVRPSIHMPRWASRITLEVTGVRVERLQDISEADAMAEGVHYSLLEKIQAGQDRWARHAYKKLWESIHGPGSWDLNPWVWVVEFKGVAQ